MGALGARLARLARLDRRVVFLVILVAVALPFVLPVHFRARPAPETRRFADALDRAIAAEGPILLSVDFGPQTMAELEPVLLGVLHRLFSAKKPVILLTFITEAAAPTRRYLAALERQYGLTYGVDYVFLGYASSYAYTMYGMGTSIRSYFHADDRGTPIEDLPLLKGVDSYGDVAAVIDVASNMFPKYFIQYGVAAFDFDFLMACTAVQATNYYPYLQTGQVKGLLAGGRAGAEYETLLLERGIIDQPGDASRGLGSQSLALAAMLLMILLGNVGYFAARRQARGRG